MCAERTAITIRTAASAGIGGGHLRRCLSLAKQLRHAGAQVRIALPSLAPPFDRWLGEAGVQGMLIGEGLEAEEDARRCVGDALSDWLVVDDYGLDARWHRAAAALGVRVASIDDLGNRPMQVDLLVDPNEHEAPRRKYTASLNPEARLLAGCRYALLDDAYDTAEGYVFQEQVRSIAVFMGATDPHNASLAVYVACRQVFDGSIEVATSSANPHLAELRRVLSADPQVSLSVDLPHLAAFHARHDLQIGAAGGASWERCRIGVPTLALQVAANQDTVMAFFERSGAAAVFRGDIDDPSALAAAIGDLLQNSTARQRMCEFSRELVDGMGARRVAVALLAHRVQLRLANEADSDIVLAWRNHPTVRAMSLQSDLINPASHAAWFESSLTNASRLMLVGMVGQWPVGFVRYDRQPEEGTARVSVFLDPALTGLGLGGRLLDGGEHALRDRWHSVKQLVADVLPANAASLTIFRAAGYDGTAPSLSKTLA